MREDQSHFIVNTATREFHINPLGRVTALAQHTRGDCQTAEIRQKDYADDFAGLVVKGFYPCGHCIGALATQRH